MYAEKFFKLLVLLHFFLITTALSKEAVLVTIAPYKYFVERIGGDTVSVQVLVPEGADPHTFEASPRQALEALKTKIWFRIGEGVERQLLNKVQSGDSTMRVVDLREGIDTLPGCCGHADQDPHIWLNPELAKKQAIHIANVLTTENPENKEIYKKNLDLFLDDLTQLDLALTRKLTPFYGKYLFVSHSAFGYFAKEYGLQQLALEHHGKEPSLKQLYALMNKVRQESIKVIFLQEGAGKKAGERVAQELNLTVDTLNPLSEDYLNNMTLIGNKIEMHLGTHND